MILAIPGAISRPLRMFTVEGTFNRQLEQAETTRRGRSQANRHCKLCFFASRRLRSFTPALHWQTLDSILEGLEAMEVHRQARHSEAEANSESPEAFRGESKKGSVTLKRGFCNKGSRACFF